MPRFAKAGPPCNTTPTNKPMYTCIVKYVYPGLFLKLFARVVPILILLSVSILHINNIGNRQKYKDNQYYISISIGTEIGNIDLMQKHLRCKKHAAK